MTMCAKAEVHLHHFFSSSSERDEGSVLRSYSFTQGKVIAKKVALKTGVCKVKFQS
jgi:hypothetical protein